MAYLVLNDDSRCALMSESPILLHRLPCNPEPHPHVGSFADGAGVGHSAEVSSQEYSSCGSKNRTKPAGELKKPFLCECDVR